MKPAACALILLLFCLCPLAASAADSDPYKVLPAGEGGNFADQSIMLLKHLSRIAQQRAWDREVEVARIRSEKDWEAYKSELLRKYRLSLGLPFPERTPLNPEIVKVLDRGSYRIENIIYQSMPEIYVTANLYVPQTGPGPFPGILFSCGHSENGKAYELYHSAALGLVHKGYVVLVYDPLGQGERYQYLNPDGTLMMPSPVREHSFMANPLFLIGGHLMALRLWDGMRGIDYLESRKEVDTTRIGCTGNSGGGTVTLHLTPLEERIKVAVLVGTVNGPDMELGTGGISDGEQNTARQVPFGITHADLMMLAWPRPYRLIKESQSEVRRETRASFIQARYLYETLGSPDKMTLVETEQPHGYFREMREPMYFWFGKWFYGRADDRLEPELTLEKEESLRCSSSGQILLERGKALWQWAAEQYKKDFPDRPAPRNSGEMAAFRQALAIETDSLFCNPRPGFTPSAIALGVLDSAGEGFTVEKFALYSEVDIYLPCLFFKPRGRDKFPTVILADSKGKTADGGALARALAGMGYGVLAVDLRGTGETRITRRSERDQEGAYEAQVLGVEAGVAYDGLRLGRPVFAMRVYDLLKTAGYLRTRPEVDAANIGLIGRNSCGMPALYAAALDPGIKGVLADSALASFSELVTAKIYTWHFMDFIPRVLRCHDLPQVAGALAPRVLWVTNPLDAEKHALDRSSAGQSYAWTADVYRNFKSADKFRLSPYSAGLLFQDTAIAWARAVFK